MKVISTLPRSADGYRQFLKIKSLPRYKFTGRSAWFPDEYAERLGMKSRKKTVAWKPSKFLLDYQAAIVRMAIAKKKFCVFADCGLGKTLMFLEYAKAIKGRVLIVSPLMVVEQTIAEATKFYGNYPIEQIAAKNLKHWLSHGEGIGITNYDAITDDLPEGTLDGLILDESSMLKSHYGKWGTKLIAMGRGVEWKLACTGTPAPNDRIEYANHAVFMDAFPTVNSFLAKFFVNRGETAERWELKPHALKPFYRALSDWSIFLTNPSTYGWKDNSETLPPIHVHIHDVDLTEEQSSIFQQKSGSLFVSDIGGIVTRSELGQMAKGRYKGEDIATHKPEAVAKLARQFEKQGESTIVWCIYNDEQDKVSALLPNAGNIDGSTSLEKRQQIIEDFKAGKVKTLVSKAKILGFGLNLQICTRMVFSGLQDSYENYYQCIKRANRYGSKKPLNVHIPVTDIERPMVENVLRKAAMVQRDTEEQERIYKEAISAA